MSAVAVFAAVGLVVFLLWAENGSQNCLNKPCHAAAPMPDPAEDRRRQISKLLEMMRASAALVMWRQALLLGLILAIPVTFLFARRFDDGGRGAPVNPEHARGPGRPLRNPENNATTYWLVALVLFVLLYGAFTLQQREQAAIVRQAELLLEPLRY